MYSSSFFMLPDNLSFIISLKFETAFSSPAWFPLQSSSQPAAVRYPVSLRLKGCCLCLVPPSEKLNKCTSANNGRAENWAKNKSVGLIPGTAIIHRTVNLKPHCTSKRKIHLQYTHSRRRGCGKAAPIHQSSEYQVISGEAHLRQGHAVLQKSAENWSIQTGGSSLEIQPSSPLCIGPESYGREM